MKFILSLVVCILSLSHQAIAELESEAKEYTCRVVCSYPSYYRSYKGYFLSSDVITRLAGDRPLKASEVHDYFYKKCLDEAIERNFPERWEKAKSGKHSSSIRNYENSESYFKEKPHLVKVYTSMVGDTKFLSLSEACLEN